MAFPITGILDQFNRANQVLTTSADWSVLGGAAVPTVNSNQIDNGTESYVGAWWDTSTFGPDCECRMLINVDGNYFGIFARLTTPAGSYDAYQASWSTSNLTLQRNDNAVQTQLGSTVTLAKAAGMELGLECIGSAIKVYTESGGTWTERISQTDSTYTTAGNVGFDYFDGASTLKLDDFGGGTLDTVIPTGTVANPDYSQFPKSKLRPAVRVRY